MAGITLLTADATLSSLAVAYDVAEKVTASAIAAWLAASFIPISSSALIWMMERRVDPRWRWLPHLLFIPAAIAVVRVGSSVYLRETGLLPDSMMTDFTLLAATGYLLLALVVHLGAFVAAAARATHKPNGG
ncbi:hypothetical protein FHS95_003266 [Sphingomonas naasensis]|uniref:Uncharacterized protein n=1 Tax=Sphingomonas naasensis TaxID=1344951 RepID=A0A4S1WEQ0_9SPHN|nr:hypothetical protein [Sphingomonas naasensis]NIJ21563.1 hypothetical protein [Sphingomonas naasensis]TGX41491.1 hypothetical protein E5A74_12775 [Sphingomonas naasensis]